MVDFSYYDKNNKLKKLSLETGQKWNSSKIDNAVINSIFNKIDNGDGYLSEFEVMKMDKILSTADNFVKTTADDKILTKKELQILQDKIDKSESDGYFDEPDDNFNLESLKWGAINKIDLNKFSLDALKNRFKEPKFSVIKTKPNKWGEVFYIVKDNTRNKELIKIYFDEYNVSINAEGEEYYYDYSGERDTGGIIMGNIESALNSNKPENDKVKEIEQEINQLTKNNAASALFFDINASHAIKKIMETKSIDINSRLALIKHIVYKLFDFIENRNIDCSKYKADLEKELKSQKSIFSQAKGDGIEELIGRLLALIKRIYKGNEKPANGKIDADFAQGGTGDCWCLAAIKSIAIQPKGRDLLNNSLKLDKFGNIYVTLRGVNKTYKISKEALEKSKGKYSYGDQDVRAIEMAVNKYIEDESKSIGGLIDNNFRKNIDGNYSTLAYYILTGKGKENMFKRKARRIQGISDEDIDNFKNKIISVGTKSSFDSVSLNGGRDKIVPHHAYTVSRVDKNKVYLINPWNSSREFSITRNQFKKYFAISYELEL